MGRLTSGLAGCLLLLGLVWVEPGPTVEVRPFLWAWERPEDLSFLDAEEVGVALFAGTLRISGGLVAGRPRLQPITLPLGVESIPVVRIEVSFEDPPSLDPAQAEEVARRLAALFRQWPSAEVQIDFDARLSERPFYRRVLSHLRDALPATTRISITALASWCLGDPWISDLPIDDAVPMLFRMGEESLAIRRGLAAGADFRLALCRSSVGLSTDEPLASLPRGRRTFLFHPEAWSSRAYQRYKEQIGR